MVETNSPKDRLFIDELWKSFWSRANRLNNGTQQMKTTKLLSELSFPHNVFCPKCEKSMEKARDTTAYGCTECEFSATTDYLIGYWDGYGEAIYCEPNYE